jgi:nitroreductase
VLAFFARRRSASALTLSAPGPSPDEVDTLIRLAARVPDHGKLSPWRFVVLEGDHKTSFCASLRAIAQDRADPEKALAALGKFAPAPTAVAVISRVTPGHKVPEWEQELSAGAAAFALLLAAQAMGFGANWITDWYSFDPQSTALLGLRQNERVAAYIFLGTPTAAPQERVRPDLPAIVSRWSAP